MLLGFGAELELGWLKKPCSQGSRIAAEGGQGTELRAFLLDLELTELTETLIGGVEAGDAGTCGGDGFAGSLTCEGAEGLKRVQVGTRCRLSNLCPLRYVGLFEGEILFAPTWGIVHDVLFSPGGGLRYLRCSWCNRFCDLIRRPRS